MTQIYQLGSKWDFGSSQWRIWRWLSSAIALIMETVSTYETLVNFKEITRHFLHEDSHIQLLYNIQRFGSARARPIRQTSVRVTFCKRKTSLGKPREHIVVGDMCKLVLFLFPRDNQSFSEAPVGSREFPELSPTVTMFMPVVPYIWDAIQDNKNTC